MLALLVVLATLMTGCQTHPKASHAGAPKAIVALTDQTLVYSCPSCGMDYDASGKCPMCDVDLVKTQVAYICPADNQPVASAGKCPRCNVNARVVKTAMAAETPAPSGAPNGAESGTKPPAAATPGAASGS
jgi:rubrerythrin